MVGVAILMLLLYISSRDPDQHVLPWNPSRPDMELAFASPWTALDRLKNTRPDVVVLELPLEDCCAEEFLESINRADPSVPVIVCHENGTVAEAVRFTKLGAFQFTTSKDAEGFQELVDAAEEDHRSRRSLAKNCEAKEPWRRFLVGESRSIQRVMEVIRLVGPRRSTVLISGETGSGKEIVARAIHMASDRAHAPMIAVNCNALPEHLLETELFGHVKGAFTGALNHRVGRFEQAHRGTLFLDEIGDLPLEIQAKLLRVLQEREFQRVGSSETVKVDVRVIAASNIDLASAVRESKFREDLYYRLNVVPLRVPALRERPSDIPILVRHLIDKVCRQEGVEQRLVSRETLERLTRYSWPGNVRQLENAVEMAIAMSGERLMLYPADFPLPSTPQLKSGAALDFATLSLPDEGLDFEQMVASMERAILEQALRKTGGNKAQAAGMLRLKRTTLSAKLKSLTILARSA